MKRPSGSGKQLAPSARRAGGARAVETSDLAPGPGKARRPRSTDSSEAYASNGRPERRGARSAYAPSEGIAAVRERVEDVHVVSGPHRAAGRGSAVRDHRGRWLIPARKRIPRRRSRAGFSNRGHAASRRWTTRRLGDRSPALCRPKVKRVAGPARSKSHTSREIPTDRIEDVDGKAPPSGGGGAESIPGGTDVAEGTGRAIETIRAAGRR